MHDQKMDANNCLSAQWRDLAGDMTTFFGAEPHIIASTEASLKLFPLSCTDPFIAMP